MYSSQTDFVANLSITNPSLITAAMLSDLPDNYTQAQDSNVFALTYGTGYEFELLRENILQMEANNYLYSPETQTQTLAVNGAGLYLVEFAIPFVNPPLNVNISGSNYTDVFIEYTDNFGMIVNVQTDLQDVLTWTASGFVGAASSEYLGDSLYQNFGALFGFPRLGESAINTTGVTPYEQTTTFITAQQLYPVQSNPGPDFDLTEVIDNNTPYVPIFNAPPTGTYFKGIIQPTSVVTSPQATHQLVDVSTNQIIALVDASTFGAAVSAYYLTSPGNLSKSAYWGSNGVGGYLGVGDPSVYVAGPISSYTFDRWDQPAYVQEVFRADSVYRRLLAGINNSLQEGPSLQGISNIVETLFAQPYIPYDTWQASDFRLFKNSIGQSNPKYFDTTTSTYLSQYDTYPTEPAVINAFYVKQAWSPSSLTYNNQPTLETLQENPKTPSATVEQLNNVTRFDISNELVRQLRLGFDLSEGGVVNWNYAGLSTEQLSGFYDNSQTQGVNYNVFFLNNPGDTYAGINLFYYALQTDGNGNASGYRSFGPLVYNQDYYIDSTSAYYDAATNTYNLPSDLLKNYAANSSIPFYNPQPGTPSVYSGAGNTGLPLLPTFVVRIQLRKYTAQILGIADYIDYGSNFPVNSNDFILYSYGQISLNPTSITGNFGVDTVPNAYENNLVQYFDSESSTSLQPNDSPFGQGSNFQVTSLAQSPFAKFETSTGYAYALTMLGGSVSFSKTINISNLLQPNAYNSPSNSSPCIFALQGLQYAITDNPPVSSTYTDLGTNQYLIYGVVRESTINGQNRIPLSLGNYCLVQYGNEDNVLAVFDTSTYFKNELAALVESNARILVQGVILQTIWNTRIPVTNYRGSSPVFQTTANFDNQLTAFTPDQTQPIAIENNFFVQILGLPLGVDYAVTATWSFDITTTSSSNSISNSAIGFPTTTPAVSAVQEGIMQLFTGNSVNTLTTINGKNVDIDAFSDGSGVLYTQTYISPSFSGWFLNYKDYIYFVNPEVGGTKLGSSDVNSYDTLTNPYVAPYVEPGQDTTLPGTNVNTVINIFSPQYGFVSLSILPNMLFSNPANGNALPAIRPNNNGFALQMVDPSHAGVVFYGKNADKVIDKPTRLVVDFTYALANLENRKKIVDIEDNGDAGWVDAAQPDTVLSGSTFFITGSEYKYAHNGFDQAANQYNDTFSVNPDNQGGYSDNLDGNVPIGVNGSKTALAGSFYNLTSNPPIFEVDPLVAPDTVNTETVSTGEAGPPARYRNPNVQTIGQPPSVAYSYYNTSVQKVSYLQFDLSSFPTDTIVNEAYIELYFASGFTVKEGKDVNFTLNHNSAWEASRLSGNGLMHQVTVTPTYTQPASSISMPLNNVHWRQNFFEILLPYAFLSEPQDLTYGIRNIFGATPQLTPTQNPQPNLEYLGFVNIDEIDTTSLTGDNIASLSENTVGLANVILTQSSIIYTVTGILTFTASTTATGTDVVNTNSPGTLSSQPVLQQNLLPNQKILLFPYGYSSNLFYYGYIKSIIPSQYIAFDSVNLAIYQQALDYVVPIYSQYVVKLLEADTYLPYTTFGRSTAVEGTSKDISA